MKNLIKIINIFIVIILGFLSFGSVAFADYSTTTTLTASGNFTVPLGVTSLNASLTAAGGGGGGGAFTYGGGGGGAGSSISNIVISVTPGQVIPYTVGVGGSAGTAGSYSASGGNGGNGGNTIFNTNTVWGGLGGQGAIVGGGGGIGGLAGDVGGTNGTNGDSFIGERHYGGNGGTSPFGTAGIGGYGSATTYTLPTAGIKGNGGGAGSGYASSLDAGANGGNGLITLSYTADLTSPIITLNGSSTITIAANSVYTDLGATAIDNVDGDITANIITAGLPISTNATGTHLVVYTVTDHAENVSSSTRTVIITDQTAPIITTPTTQIFEATGVTTTPALFLATATDNIDTNPVVIHDLSSFGLGTSTVIWTATDSSGNVSTSSSLVVIKDTTAPIITMNGSSTMSFMVGNTYTELGADAFDLVDGTTSVSIMGSVNGNVVGTYFIIYSSVDLSGNTASIFRTINVTPDTISPVIIAPIDQIFEATGATTNPILTPATSTDNFTLNPVITYSPADFSLGTTTVVWTATDEATNFSTTTSLVTIIDTTAPVITLNGSSTIDLFTGDIYVELGASSTDLVDGSVAVSATGTVNTNATGTYSVLYTATDSSGNVSTTTRVINVTLAPAVLTSISILPLSPSLFVGATTTFVSTTLDQYNNSFATTTDWISSDVSVGTVDAGGIFTALSAGTTTVTASAGIFSTSTEVTVSNIIIPDTTAPTVPTILNSSATGTIITSADISWTDSVDTESGLQGYLIFTDSDSGTQISSSTGSTLITSTSTTVTITLGTSGVYWFHVASIDNDGNISTTTNVGPFVMSDSEVLYKNSTIGGTSYTIYSPTLAESIIASTTGVTLISDSSISTFWNINNSTLTTTTINDANLDSVISTNSTFTNSDVARCTVTNSLVKNYFARDCYIAYSVIDPSSGLNEFISSTSTNSQIFASDIYNSLIDYSYIATSTITDSNINYSTSTNSVISTSTVDNFSVIDVSNISMSDISNSHISNSVIVNGTSTDSTLTNSTSTDSIISSSTFTNVEISSSTITNSNISDVILLDAVIDNNIISSGTITINGTPIVITQPTAISSLTNSAPVAAFSIATSSLLVTITDNTTDANEGTSFADSWTYDWNFGDGATSTIFASSTNVSPSHTYASSGSYTIDLTVTDSYGATSSTSTVVDVSAGGSGPLDTTAPVITILGSNPVTVVASSTIASSTYSDAGATALDYINGDLTGSIHITNLVNIDIPGVYTVTYSVSDLSGNNSTSTRIVNVVATADVVKPVITILGLNPENILVSKTYTDAGATSTDDVDGDITSHIVTTGLPIDTSATGTHYVNYSVTDGAGNSTSSTRTVNVIDVPVDTIPPVITINGGDLTIAVGSSYIDAGATAYDAVSGTTTVSSTNNVNTSATGTYSVVYSATDSALNTATTSRTVNVIAAAIDNIAPVINITGGTPITLSVGGTYTDLGATAIDNVNGPVVATTTSNNVDTSIAGSYSVVYSAIDASLNNSTAIRTVNVVEATSTDNIPPVIFIIGGTPITIVVGTEYTDAGAEAYDAFDNATTTATTTGTVNKDVIGTYTITYTASDIAGNISTATRDVKVVSAPPDLTPPVITLNGGSSLTIAVGSSYVDAGATAYDAVSGTTTVVVVSNDVNTSATGTYSVVYSSTDAALNVATTSRSVNVILDGIAPTITIFGDNPMEIIRTLSYSEAGATAVDNIDATTSIVISGSVDTNATGTYTMVYTATDSSGNIASSTRIINVISDNVPPVITMAGSAAISLIVGDTYTELGATAIDNVDGPVVATTTSNNVDTSIAGSYSVIYSAIDAAGNEATSTRAVNVIAADHVPPTINILGSNPVTVLQYSSYTDAGATALDDINGNLTSDIVTTNPVVTFATGTYAITYVVSDAQGNTATGTRIVNVVATPDTTVPVITILGSNPVSLTVGDTYTDIGASAIDDVDGDITSNITKVSTVNNLLAGSYSVVYTVIDGAGNSASSTRVVNVNNPAPTLSSIAIATPANKLSYTVNDLLDITGLIITGTYSDGSTSTEAITSGNITGFNSSVATVGQVLTITIGTKTTTYTVNINAAPIVSGGGGGGGGSSYYAVGDINSDNKIDEYDFSIMMSQWGQMFSNLSSDINHDGRVDEYDFSLLMFNWK